MGNLLIYNGSVSVQDEEFTEFDIQINLKDGFFIFDNEKKNFKNLIDLLALFENNFVFNNVVIYGSILDYSSEINVRTMFAGFFGLASNVFKYIDNEETLYSRAGLLSRVFNAVSINPEFNKLNRYIALKFRKELKNTWDDIERALVYRTVSENMLSTKEFIELASDSIDKKKSFSFIRVNHCENRLLGYGLSYSQEEAEITYKIQFGYKVEASDTFLISNMLRTALADADAIGLPTLKKTSSNKLNILENSTYFHLQKFNCYLKKKYTSVTIHYDLGRSLDFKKLLLQASNIYAITCRDLSKIESSLGRKIKAVKIPAEYVYSENNENEKHYPDVFIKVLNYIQENIKPGDLVLVGAGILGKIYCNEVKRAGGVAIDLGSLFDAISGINTRGNGFGNDFWWNTSD